MRLSPMILLLCLPAIGLAQSSWEISLEGGPAFPVGKFGSSDARDARIYSESLQTNGTPYINYYSFEKNGFARTGWYTTIQAVRNLNLKWKILIQYQYSRFPVEDVIAGDFTNYVGREYSYEQSDYRIGQIMSGLGFNENLGSFTFDFQLTAGIARSSFPFYKIIDEYDSDNPDRINYEKIYFGHEGDRKADDSFIWGASTAVTISVSSSLETGIRMGYSASGFDYHFDPRWIPGGSGNLEYNDHLPYRSVSLGLMCTFTF